MKYVGPHVSTQGGVEQAPLNAAGIGAKAFGLFVKNQRQWQAPPTSPATCAAFAENMRANGYRAGVVLPHAGYLINLANPDPEAHARSTAALTDELRRCAALGLDRLNLHPGSHLKKITPAEAVKLVAQAINKALEEVSGVTVVLEGTAGQGGCLGANFEELAAMLALTRDRTRVGFCLDTAHLFGAGFDLRTPAAYARTMAQFDDIVGRQYLRGMHLNDTKVALGSRVDRHASLGDGQLGWETFALLMRDPRLDDLPLILETPDEDRWPEEIRRLYELVK
ncbi:MAG: deoxyribonuclease IV [Kiritimatiellae bacterium]|nr:deoxyribonuclease IV [Kiritimatiellia bacterium]